MKTKPLIVLASSVLIFISGCVLLFPRREPNRNEFSLYSIKASSQLVRSNGVYYFTTQTEDKHVTQYVIRFDKEGMVYFKVYGGIDDHLDFAKADIKKLANEKTMCNKGFYYQSADTIKMELLDGDSGHGYWFEYFNGLIQGDGIFVTQTSWRAYKHLMKGAGFELMHARSFQFQPDTIR
jgi:hypothetical protein